MKEFYCKLEAEGSSLDPLERRIDPRFLNKSFDKLVDYMMEPNTDDTNQAYQGQDLDQLDELAGVYASRDNPSSNVTLIGKIDGGVDEVNLPFDKKVGFYFDRIKSPIVKGEDPADQEIYDSIHLILQQDDSGGNYDL